MKRKIIQLAPSPRGEGDYCGILFALCDDGTVWWMNNDSKEHTWNLERGIPQKGEEEYESGSSKN